MRKPKLTPAEMATIMRDQPRDAARLLGRTSAGVRSLRCRLRKLGYNCGPFLLAEGGQNRFPRADEVQGITVYPDPASAVAAMEQDSPSTAAAIRDVAAGMVLE